jgi:hypothetical protein
MIRFYGEKSLAPRPTPQAGGPPRVDCPRLLIQYIRSYPPHWRPFLHPQTEDAPFADPNNITSCSTHPPVSHLMQTTFVSTETLQTRRASRAHLNTCRVPGPQARRQLVIMNEPSPPRGTGSSAIISGSARFPSTTQ